MADPKHFTVTQAGMQMAKSAAEVRALLADQVDEIAARCSTGTATSNDADLLANNLAQQRWMTFQGSDLLQQIARRIRRNGGNATDALFLSEYAEWTRTGVAGARAEVANG